MMEADVESIVDTAKNKAHSLRLFMEQVASFFSSHPSLTKGSPPIVHTVKSRLKDYDHLRDKINRKIKDGRKFTTETVFEEITDLAGVRVLHIYQDQFPVIHKEIMAAIGPGSWELHENPKAYTWDPETAETFRRLNLDVKFKDSYYTSVHYVIRANALSPLRCEIQVRTLFEEVWGEIDHAINYPQQTDNRSCREQLRVLAKLVATGTRLADSLFRTHYDRNLDYQNDHHEEVPATEESPASSRD